MRAESGVMEMDERGARATRVEPDGDRPTSEDVEPVSNERPARRGKPDEPRPREVGGPAGPEPTRFGDWERRGRCIDF